MYEAKNTQRALVRIGYDGRVYKHFRGPEARSRFENEVRVLQYLEERGCDFVPRLIDFDPEQLQIVTTHCGQRVDQLNDEKVAEIFSELEQFGVKHDDPFLRNITYRASDGRFCVIDFELATILQGCDHPATTSGQETPQKRTTQIQWSGMTHPGRYRRNNEDSFLALLLDRRGIRYLGKTGEASTESHDLIFAVSDGMGGERSGEFASKISIEKITSIMTRYSRLTSDRFVQQSDEILRVLFDSIHREMNLLGRVDPNCLNMGATLSLAWLKSEHLCFGHIGDSRIYLLPKGGGIQQLTSDHTYVGWLRRTGQINEREARTHPRKNVLTQALGAGHQYMHPQIDSLKYRPGDRFLLCTDGVIDGIWDRNLEEMVRAQSETKSDPNPAQRIVMEAVRASGLDNATALVIETREIVE